MSSVAVDAKTALSRIAGPGQVLGLAAVLSGVPHLTTTQTTAPSVRGFLHEKDLISTMEGCPKFAQVIARTLAKESKEIELEMLLLRVPRDSSQRLAAVLVRLANIDGTAISREIPLTYTHAELAQLIGASRETVTRVIKKFERKGIIKTKKLHASVG